MTTSAERLRRERSAERLQELESQLSGLEQVKPQNQKERKKLEQEKETLTRTVASLKAYLALEVGGQVTDGAKFGVIISKTLSLDGILQAWVSWSGAVEVPEPPERLTVIKPPSYAIADLLPSLPESQLADWQQQRMPSTESGKAYLIERTGARNDRDLLVRPSNEPSWTIKANIATDHKGANRHDPLNALLPDGKVVSLDARAGSRSECLRQRSSSVSSRLV